MVAAMLSIITAVGILTYVSAVVIVAWGIGLT